MVRNLSPVGRVIGNENHIKSDELKNTTLSQEEYREIWAKQSSKHQHYAAGYGVPHREGNAGFADLDLQTSGTSPTAIEANVRWEVYRDSNKEELVAVGAVFDAATLRTDVNESKTDKTLIPVKSPGAGEDGYLVLAAKAKPSSDGDTVGSSNSATGIGMPYSRISV